MMKTVKAIIVIVFFLYSDLVKCQSTPTCGGTNAPLPCSYTPDWHWWDVTITNWLAQIASSTTTMSCPFYGNSNSDDMVSINNSLDYLPVQGWTLMGKDFGCAGGQAITSAMPYFILYNKYKGVIRVFLYFGNQIAGSNASLVLKWSSVNGAQTNNSLLTLSNQWPHPNDFYLNNSNADNEKHFNYINPVATNGGWSVTEYIVNFDPNTIKSPDNFQYIKFDFQISTTGNITMEGAFSFSTQSATAKEPATPTTNSGNSNLLDNLVTGKSAIAKAPKKSKVVSGFQTIASKVDSTDAKFCTNFTRSLHNFNNSLQNGKLKQYLINAAGLAEDVGGLLGVAGSVVELFMSKSNSAVSTSTETFFQPTISEGTMKLNGTIITAVNPLNISIQLPGTSHKFSNGTVNCPNLPIYDCPLGIISLQEAPSIEVRTWTEPERVGNYVCSLDFDLPTGLCNNPSPPANGVTQTTLLAAPSHTTFHRSAECPAIYNTRTIKSYKVTGDVKLALNGAAGVEIESARAALFFVINDTTLNIYSGGPTPPAACCNPTAQLPNNCNYLINNGPATNVPTFFNLSTTYQDVVPYKNYVKDLLNDNILKLSHHDSLGFHRFQTEFIDIEKFKNTAVTIQSGSTVYLKILVTLRPTNLSDDQTPIINVITYEIPSGKFISNSGTTPYTMTCAQKLGMESVVIGQNNVSSSLGNTVVAGVKIESAQSSTLTVNPSSGTSLEAFSSISLRPHFTTQIQYGGLFRAFLNPSLGGCAAGTNALVVNTHTYNCANNGAGNKLMVTHDVPGFIIDEQQNHQTVAEEIQGVYMKIAPNPNNGNFTLMFSKRVGPGIIEVYSTVGVKVLNQILPGGATNYELNLNEQLSKGVYYLTWSDGQIGLNKKLIIN